MRIAFVSTILSYPWGGADSLWTSAAEEALDRGDTVLLAISEPVARHPRIGSLRERGAALHIRLCEEGQRPFWRRAWRRRPWSKDGTQLLRARIRSFAPDLLVFSCGGTYDTILETALVDWLLASGTPYRIIANFQHEHPSLGEADRIRAREILTAADRIFCVSPRNLEITRLHLLSPLPNAECLHNPLLPVTESPWAPTDPWSIACIGRLEPVKGVDLLLAALAGALGDVLGWRLNIYGQGPQEDYLEACAQHFRISDKVSFRGFVPNLQEIWAQNHMLVSPAVDEGVPMTIPEAMLRGRPVLATRVGGADEWIEHGRTGFICAAPAVGLLTDSLREAWSLRPSWRDMGQAAAVRASALYRPGDFRRVVA
jgi:glycosyltransferase involved in cell wall biosynthesis